MEPEQRYQILGTLGTGDFGTVYRARDVELTREVAIKQIHYQFMQDPRQLDRYWQEAQILANLHHQYIMTIYDIVRPRGWLILELMRGSLPAELQGRPIDIETLRIALTQSLHALDFLHTKGVIHGDVKPSNLLIGMNNRLKLGDFGLARRAGNAAGSLLKGTPKYMAPEVMSDQFGPVGPTSDLYSLGFTCYELLCGSHFDSLFPGLSSFGRDMAVAWMMWHAAPDRRLPEIGKVLDGVPEDLARVIQQLIVKDQSQRYRSAGQALEDLREIPLAGPSPKVDEAAVAEAARQARRKRMLAIGAFAGSVVLSVGLLFMTGGTSEKQSNNTKQQADQVRSGQIKQVDVDKKKVVLVLPADRRPLEITVPATCEILLNGKDFILLDDVQAGDEAEVTLAPVSGLDLLAQRIVVSRPEVEKGTLISLDMAKLELKLRFEVPGQDWEVRVLYVPSELKPRLNGQPDSMTLNMLHAGDRLVAHYFMRSDRREIVALDVLRLVTLTGTLKLYTPDKREIEVTLTEGDKLITWRLTLGAECAVTLDGRFASPQDLAPGDQVTVTHDMQVVKIEAHRGAAGGSGDAPPADKGESP